MRNNILILGFIVALVCKGFSQDHHLVDSLQASLKNAKHDTVRIDILKRLAGAYWRSDLDKATQYANEILEISENNEYKRGFGIAYNILAVVETRKGNFYQALDIHKKALKFRTETGRKEEISSSLSNIGNVYRQLGNLSEALNYLFEALKIDEEIGNKNGLAALYANIGAVYQLQGNIDKGLEYNYKALKINKELGNKEWQAVNYNSIGDAIYQKGDYDEALKYHHKALKIQKEIGDKLGIALSFHNIGQIYNDMGNFHEAIKNLKNALSIFIEMGNKTSIAETYNTLSYIYIEQKNYVEAKKYIEKSLEFSKETRVQWVLANNYYNLSRIDSALGNYQQAFKHLKLFIAYSDSIDNEENTKKMVQSEMQYEFDKKEALTKAESDAKLRKQKLLRNGFLGGFAIVLLFAIVFFRQRNKTKKQKKLAEEEKQRSEELLLNILPQEVAHELKATGAAKARSFTMVTVMFTDFKDFTRVSEQVSAELLVDEIHQCFSAFDNIIQKYKVEKIKTIGDAYLCASGLPVSSYTHAVDMVHAASEINNFMVNRKKEKESRGEIAFELRIGIHTGPVVAGIVGVKKYAYDIWGDTVNIAARMEQNSEAGRINISGSTYQLVKDKFHCVHRGKIEAKNKGEIDMFFIEQRNEIL